MAETAGNYDERLGHARRYLEHDYARHTLSGTPAEEAHRQAKELAQQHPGIEDLALAATGDEMALGRKLRRHQLRRRRQIGMSAERAGRIRDEHRGRPASRAPRQTGPTERRARPTQRTPAGRRAPQVRPPRAARSAARTVVRAATDTHGWGDTLLQMFGWGIGLSILYLILTRPVVPARVTTSMASFTRAIVSPHIDPLDPHGAGLKVPLNQRVPARR